MLYEVITVLLSAAIAYATVTYGHLNLIAPVVSMFFLISYGLLNYATYYEARSQSPSFRPRFRYFNVITSYSIHYTKLYEKLDCPE